MPCSGHFSQARSLPSVGETTRAVACWNFRLFCLECSGHYDVSEGASLKLHLEYDLTPVRRSPNVEYGRRDFRAVDLCPAFELSRFLVPA